MGSNAIGRLYTLTTAGESHGPGYVGIIDGVPSGFKIVHEEIQRDLDLRAPGRSLFSSQRKELDQVEILAGIYDGFTTGAPIAFFVPNRDQRSKDYDFLKEQLRPGHADFTYLEKYGHADLRGGGRASARETLCRVVAGSIAKQILRNYDIDLLADVRQIQNMRAPEYLDPLPVVRERVLNDPFGCHDPSTSADWRILLEKAMEKKDSLSSSVCFRIDPMLQSLGEPVYNKLTNKLADALMSIPAAKGFILGDINTLQTKTGSEFNDPYVEKNGSIRPIKNDMAGILGGISTGEPIFGELFFKPPSSVGKQQISQGKTLTINGRHDPLLAPRARIVVESMLWITLMDFFLLHQTQLHLKRDVACHAK
jgi:chorismate synthase